MTTVDAIPYDDLGDAGADAAVTALFRLHYAGLVRLAVLLVDDDGSAEDLVQDAFARLFGATSIVTIVTSMCTHGVWS